MIQSNTKVYVWDGFIRSYHWLQVLIISSCWWTAETGYLAWHMLLASALLALWLTRIIWGFIGPTNARFAEFWRGPKATLQYARAMLIGKTQIGEGNGHDPLGAWMIMALLTIIGLQLITGLFSSDGFFASGPLAALISSDLSDLVTQWHHTLFNGIWILAAIHIGAVVIFELRGERLIRPMIVGSKQRPLGATGTDNTDTHAAATCIDEPARKPTAAWVAFAIAIVIWIVLFAGFQVSGSLVGLTN